MADLTRQQLDELGKLQTCAAANAIETFNVIPRDQGFMRPAVRSIFPELGNMIGYAVTGLISAKTQPSEHMRIARTTRRSHSARVRLVAFGAMGSHFAGPLSFPPAADPPASAAGSRRTGM